MNFTPRETLHLHLQAQRLTRGLPAYTSTVSQVIQKVVGVQAQDLSAAALSVRARSRGLTAEDVEVARNVDRSIVWTWALRGTLHLIDAADFYWMIQLLGPRFIAGNNSRRRQLGLDEVTLEKGSRIIREALANTGPLTRAEIEIQLGAQGIQAQGQQLPHLIFYTAMLGDVCHGPDKNGESTFVLARDWIGPDPLLLGEAALSELARRYLAAYAPATAEDLAAWSGASLSDARLGLAQIADEIFQVEAAGQPMVMLKSHMDLLDEIPAESNAEPIVRLLPWFDTYMMGYASRELVVDPANRKRINAGGGMLHPTLLIDGRLAGVWSKKQRNDTLLINLEPFESLNADLRPYLQAEAEDIARFLGLKLDLHIAPLS